ncbi:unnamed protein product [Caenorhabditis angaria]|uniref:BAG domain-containing protein n=1 Tax=Caenorhabditis angaria TaxID=860376 RepID=A0A9P1IW95_9PELO|nr:unnamed protein product [Caenorhabditis angaria]
MPIVNIPIKILGQPHTTHSRSNSSSSVDTDRIQPQPQPQYQPNLQSQQQPNQPQQQQQQQQNMHNNSGFFPSRSPIPDFPSNFPSSAFDNDPDWPNFPRFPSEFGNHPGFSNFHNFGREGGLSPNPQMSNFARRSPTPASPTSTLRRNSANQQQTPNVQQTRPESSLRPESRPQSRPQSRAQSRQGRENKETETPERPAVIPLPYEKVARSTPSTPPEENIAKISIGKTECAKCPISQETDGDPSPLTSPIEGKMKRGKKLQRKQSVVDFNAKTVVTLDQIEQDVEKLRKRAAEMEIEKEQILKKLGEISMHSNMLRLEECDREEIEAVTSRLLKRTQTVQVSVETPRNEEQKKALEQVSTMIDEVENLIKTDVEKSKIYLQTYMNACASEETNGAVCANFLKIIIQCAADDQKRIKRRLQNLQSQIENAEQTRAGLLDEDSSE